MDLKPGDRIIYAPEYFAKEGGTFVKTTLSERGEVRYWFYFDTEPERETYVTNFKLMTREYSLTDHDLQPIN